MTVSPKDPVTQECQKAIVKYIQCNCVYGYVVSEHGKSGKLHLHCIMVFDQHKDRAKMQENITVRQLRPNGHPEAKNGRAVLVTVAYKHDWYDTYLKKETDFEVLYNKYDREEVTAFFPPESTQEFLQSTKRSTGLPADLFMHNHVQRWVEMHPDASSPIDAVTYLKTRMFKLKDMVVIHDPRRLTQIARSLYSYRFEITKPCDKEVQLMREFDGFNADDSIYSYAQHPAARPAAHERI